MSEIKTDFKNITYSQTVSIISPEDVRQERIKYNKDKIQLKKALYKTYYHNNYFNGTNLTLKDRILLMSGFSPIYMDSKNRECFRYTIHHIVPISCGGQTVLDNLIPLPRKFHDFIHSKIIDPQIFGSKTGDKIEIKGLPDFSKITLEQMQDENFIRDYQKFLVDCYDIIPVQFKKMKKSDRTELLNCWYKTMFGKERT